ncbi:hypothetical protein Cgig2_024026 [Carnegiea gigantea]|uniref:Uncharacterized protein n=1 Tax=Carnegiea gigantea TaxID=171969 RepID=A0A9Q1QJF2_9CARY|nr:hypothetical protein Cgig2_024026 [Carnegiea gigantea]
MEEAAHEFDIPEMIQATFHAMVVNDASKLGVMSRDMARALKSVLEALRWLIFKSWLRIKKHAFLGVRNFVPPLKIAIVLYYLIMSSSCSSSEIIPTRPASPQMEARCPQFPSLPALIDGRVVVYVHPKNHLKEPKKIPYKCRYMSSSPLHGLVPSTPLPLKLALLVPLRAEEKVACLAPTHRLPIPGVGCAQKKSVPKVIAERTVFPGAPTRTDLQDRPSTHFPNPKVVGTLKRPPLEERYLLPARCKFIIPDADASMNKLPSKCRKDFPYWNDGKLVRSLFGEPIAEEIETVRCLQYYLQEDDFSKAMKQEIVSENETHREEERRPRVKTQAKKAPVLAPCSRKSPTVSCSVPREETRKHPRTEEGQDAAAVSARTPLRTKTPPSKGRAPKVGRIGEQVQAPMGEFKKEKESLEVEKGTCSIHWRKPAPRLRPRPSWELREKLGLNSKTLAPDDFRQEGYFKACMWYIEDRYQARAEGKNPELVDFILPRDDKDLGDNENIVPLGGEVARHHGDDDETTARKASDDKDPSI